ncbi:MAG: TlpA family protein disulfide reductase [Gammaproteobacteria bacterium]|nr:TlpA family protein disulfide reductase [Gammaproteobacteria bacterium]
MKQGAGVTILLAACAVAGFLAFRMLNAPAATTAPDTVPDFVLTKTNGEAGAISDYLGKPLVLNFWATWCPPCLREIPLLVDLDERQGEHIQVLGVAIDRMEPVLEFMERLAVAYPVLVGEQDAMQAAGSFGDAFVGLPFTVFADAQGNILGVHTGEIHAPDMPPIESTLLALAAGEITQAQAQRALSDLDQATR